MSKELTIKDEEKQGLAIPDYAAEFASDGKEDVDADSIGKTFLKLVQKTSKEFDEKIADLGEFIDSVSGQNYGKEVVITVIKISKEWRKFGEGNKLESRSTDGKKWDDGTDLTEEETWKNKYLDFFVLLNEQTNPIPMILSLAGTSFKTAKMLNTQIAKFVYGNNEPIFLRNYTVYSEVEQNDKGKFAVAKVKLNSGFNSKELCITAKQSREMVKNVAVDIESAADDVVTEETGFKSSTFSNNEEELEID